MPQCCEESSQGTTFYIHFVAIAYFLVIFWHPFIIMGNFFSSPNRQPDQSVANEAHAKNDQSFSCWDNLDHKQILIRLLKARYKRLYDAVQPIPYIRDRLYCVDRVFVEGGIEYSAGTWVPLDSYHGVFINEQIKSKRRILLGEAGYGKSTLTLQYAYDWCNSVKQSVLKDVDILILLRLRQLGGVSSIYRAVKEFLLPRHCQLSESNIKSILHSGCSVVVVLDGLDEYPDEDSDVTTDVLKIIQMHMFQQFEVILTTRYLPKRYPSETKQLRLIGFDERARDEYIRKAVVGHNTRAANAIKQRLQQNPVLADLCQVPLFFVMFAHMSHENKEFKKFKTVTNFFQYMIRCFHSHLRNKQKDKNVQNYELHEDNHQSLDEVAFEGLRKANQQIVWSRQELRNRLGHAFYDEYIKIGILVEEDYLDDDVDDDDDDDDDDVDDDDDYYDGAPSNYHHREVRFYHKLFCEWYAAHQLGKCAEEIDFERFIKLTQNMDPFDLQYCYRFACGLNNAAAGKVIQSVKRFEGGDKFAVLCILEQGGKVDGILDEVKELCTGNIIMSKDDNKLLQRSILQLLEIASSHKISISCVYLDRCYSTVDLRGGNHLQLKSNLSIPVLTTLNVLVINTRYEGREIISEEFTGILQYSSKCLALKELRFSYCLLPPYVQTDSVSVLRSRNVEVFWDPQGFLFFGTAKYQLNLQSGRWEHWDSPRDGEQMTDEEYRVEASRYRQYRR